MAPVHAADGCAGFGIAGEVGQFVVFAKCLAFVPGTDPAGEVYLFFHHVGPECIHSPAVGAVLLQGGNVGHGSVHINSPHIVAHDFVLRYDQTMVLRISAVEGAWWVVSPRWSRK